MSQDTRKDRRVKIVSLNVRYKSATVDEFIDNHAHDVSRGGIYIKTTNPFPTGTLLKFEIRLASDKAVIAGVGRVVWKREKDDDKGERPAGMGVKFIKVDDTSKVVIERLVSSKSDAGRAFDSEPEAAGQRVAGEQAPPRAAAAPPSNQSSTPTRPVNIGVPPSQAVPPAAPPKPSLPSRERTSLGIGPGSTASTVPPRASAPAAPRIASSTAPPRASVPAAAAVPRPGQAGPVFPPQTASAPPAAGTKQEQTVMKQAAELLEEALREAGGSMEEVGSNPLFGLADEKGGVSATTTSPPVQKAESTTDGISAEDGTSTKPSTQPAASSIKPADTRQPTTAAKGPDEAAVARGMVAAMVPASGQKGRGGGAATRPVPSAATSTASESPSAKKRRGSGAGLIVLTAIAVAVAVVAINRDKIFQRFGAATGPAMANPPAASAEAAGPSPAPSAQVPAQAVDNTVTEGGSPAAAASAPSAGASVAAALAAASAMPGSSASAVGASPDAGRTAQASAGPNAGAAGATPSVEHPSGAAEAPKARAAGGAEQAKSAGAANAGSLPAAASPPPKPAAPPKAAKPAKPSDDNPY